MAERESVEQGRQAVGTLWMPLGTQGGCQTGPSTLGTHVDRNEVKWVTTVVPNFTMGTSKDAQSLSGVIVTVKPDSSVAGMIERRVEFL